MKGYKRPHTRRFKDIHMPFGFETEHMAKVALSNLLLFLHNPKKLQGLLPKEFNGKKKIYMKELRGLCKRFPSCIRKQLMAYIEKELVGFGLSLEPSVDDAQYNTKRLAEIFMPFVEREGKQ